jgi:hypothetical protein
MLKLIIFQRYTEEKWIRLLCKAVGCHQFLRQRPLWPISHRIFFVWGGGGDDFDGKQLLKPVSTRISTLANQHPPEVRVSDSCASLYFVRKTQEVSLLIPRSDNR